MVVLFISSLDRKYHKQILRKQRSYLRGDPDVCLKAFTCAIHIIDISTNISAFFDYSVVKDYQSNSRLLTVKVRRD